MTSSETDKDNFEKRVSGVSYDGMKMDIHPLSFFWGIQDSSRGPITHPHPKPTPVLNPIPNPISSEPPTVPVPLPPVLIPNPFNPSGPILPTLPSIPGLPGHPTVIGHPPIVNLTNPTDPLDPSGPVLNSILGGEPTTHIIPGTSIQVGTLTIGDITESVLRKTYTALIDGTLDFKTWVKFVANGIIPTKLTFVPPALPPQCNVIRILYSLNNHPEKLDHPIQDSLPDAKAHVVVNSELGNQEKNIDGTVFVYTDQTKNILASQMHEALKFSSNVWIYMYRQNRYVKVIIAPRPTPIQHIPTPSNPKPTPTHTDCTLL